MDDLPRREETLRWNPETASLTAAMLEARDSRLLAVLREQLNSIGAERRRLAVVYGAQHMRTVLRELVHLGFYVSDSSWQTVFSLG